MHIRPARLKDSAGLAKVQVDSYRKSYRGLLPADYLAKFSYAEQTSDWQEILSDSQHDPLFVAVDTESETIVGYALGRKHAGEFGCELVAVHVLPEYHRQGIGTQLIATVAQHFAAKNCQSLLLWTMKSNQRARNLYEKLGGQLISEKQCPISESEFITEVSYGWWDIRVLVQSSK